MANNEEYENLIQGGEGDDLGLAIQALINDNIKALGTAFLAKITAINGNKVSIKPIIKRKENEQVLIINNCLVAFSFSNLWQTQFKLKIGDIGIGLVMENDISLYKQKGNESLIQSERIKDKNDSIFIPLSLYKTLNNNDINYYLESSDKVCKFEFNNDNIGKFKAKLLTLESENTTLKKKLIELSGLLEKMAGGNTAADGHGHSSTTAPASVGSFSTWAASLDTLFKD